MTLVCSYFVPESSGSSSSLEDLPTVTTSTPPKFTSALIPAHVTAGCPLVMECHVTGDPVPHVTWYKDGVDLSKAGEYQQSYNGAVARLVVDECFLDDAGEYRVVAKNSAGENISVAKATVIGTNSQVLSVQGWSSRKY